MRKDVFIGMNLITKEPYLNKSCSQPNMIGIYGKTGAGKTILASLIALRDKENVVNTIVINCDDDYCECEKMLNEIDSCYTILKRKDYNINIFDYRFSIKKSYDNEYAFNIEEFVENVISYINQILINKNDSLLDIYNKKSNYESKEYYVLKEIITDMVDDHLSQIGVKFNWPVVSFDFYTFLKVIKSAPFKLDHLISKIDRKLLSITNTKIIEIYERIRMELSSYDFKTDNLTANTNFDINVLNSKAIQINCERINLPLILNHIKCGLPIVGEKRINIIIEFGDIKVAKNELYEDNILRRMVELVISRGATVNIVFNELEQFDCDIKKHVSTLIYLLGTKSKLNSVELPFHCNDVIKQEANNMHERSIALIYEDKQCFLVNTECSKSELAKIKPLTSDNS